LGDVKFMVRLLLIWAKLHSSLAHYDT
jgi:hypothetical protein